MLPCSAETLSHNGLGLGECLLRRLRFELLHYVPYPFDLEQLRGGVSVIKLPVAAAGRRAPWLP